MVLKVAETPKRRRRRKKKKRLVGPNSFITVISNDMFFLGPLMFSSLQSRLQQLAVVY